MRHATSAIALCLALAGCDAGISWKHLELAPLRESMRRLNALEDRTLAEVQFAEEGPMFRVVSVQNLQAVQQEARKAFLVGCAGPARDALVTATDQFLAAQDSAAESPALMAAWDRMNAYREAAEACEASLAQR